MDVLSRIKVPDSARRFSNAVLAKFKGAGDLPVVKETADPVGALNRVTERMLRIGQEKDKPVVRDTGKELKKEMGNRTTAYRVALMNNPSLTPAEFLRERYPDSALELVYTRGDFKAEVNHTYKADELGKGIGFSFDVGDILGAPDVGLDLRKSFQPVLGYSRPDRIFSVKDKYGRESRAWTTFNGYSHDFALPDEKDAGLKMIALVQAESGDTTQASKKTMGDHKAIDQPGSAYTFGISVPLSTQEAILAQGAGR